MVRLRRLHCFNHPSLSITLRLAQSREVVKENACPMQRLRAIPADWHHVERQARCCQMVEVSRETIHRFLWFVLFFFLTWITNLHLKYWVSL